MPRLSVVMSVYNGAKHLPRSIESILAQTWRDFEFIIVDDGSKDETPAILRDYQQRDRRIQLITQPNAGLTNSLIRGCQLAKGEFIARQDADDWSAPTRFEQQLAMFDANSELGLVSCTTRYIGPNDELLESVSRDDDPLVATRKLLEERNGPPAHGSMMFLRALYEQVGGYRPEFYFGQDADLWLRMAQRQLIGYVSECLYHWRRNPDGISGKQMGAQHLFGELGQQCLAARRAGVSEAPFLDAARKLKEQMISTPTNNGAGRSTMLYLIGSTLRQQGDPRARTYFWQAAQTQPTNWRAWLRWLTSC